MSKTRGQIQEHLSKLKHNLPHSMSSLCKHPVYFERWFEETNRTSKWKLRRMLNRNMNLDKSYIQVPNQSLNQMQNYHYWQTNTFDIPPLWYCRWITIYSLVDRTGVVRSIPFGLVQKGKQYLRAGACCAYSHYLKMGISWPRKNYSRNSISWPENIVGQLVELHRLHIGGWVHFTKWKHDNRPINIFVTESLPESALSP